jgi:SAM-dependent methyltransferase
VAVTGDARSFFAARHGTYDRFIRAVRYPQGLRSFWLDSPLVRPGLRVLEAGCGTGALTLAVWQAMERRAAPPAEFDAFDLTPAMLERLRESLRARQIERIALAEANVLELDDLPEAWRDYDLVVTASMLEYVPRDRFAEALRGLRTRLRPGGTLVLFITRRNVLTRWLIGLWWASNLYTRRELCDAFASAGFSGFAFRRFPRSAWHLRPWGFIVEAQSPFAHSAG